MPHMQLFNFVFVQFDHSEYKNLEDSMVVGVSLLTSYEHMGTLEMACYKGCTCNSSIFDTCNPNMAWSEVRWAFHPVKVSYASSEGFSYCVLSSPGLVLPNFTRAMSISGESDRVITGRYTPYMNTFKHSAGQLLR